MKPVRDTIMTMPLRPAARAWRNARCSNGFSRSTPGEAESLEHRAGGRALHRERRDLLGHLADLDVEADRGVEQPVDLALRGAQPVLALAEAKHRAVVDEVAGIIAPHAVGDPSGLELARYRA